ncbi:hypothetical protein ACIGQE_03180 [Streptomyces sp. NPDC053429]|uniref:hypothetical protein n=1 Tax=Streptomyces sp. NPDC053429 TaxID=3365702 RepID=UPI0037CED4E0
MDARTALAHWLATLDRERLTALLEERDLPPAPRPALADHLLADASVGRALLARTAGELELLASVAALALDRYGPADEAPRYPWRQPAQRLVPERDVLAWFEPGEERRRAQRTLTLLRERALLLPAPAGRLALPPLLHARAAARAGYGRPVARLLTAAYGAAELKRIADALFGPGAQPRTGDQARHLVTGFLTDPARVRDLAAKAPARARKLLAALVPGPPQLRTRCDRMQAAQLLARFRPLGRGAARRGVVWRRSTSLNAGVTVGEYEIEGDLTGRVMSRPTCDPKGGGLADWGSGIQVTASRGGHGPARKIANACDVMSSEPPEDDTDRSHLVRLYRWAAVHFKKLLGVIAVAVVGVVVQQVAVRCSAEPPPLGPTSVHYVHLVTDTGDLIPPFVETRRLTGGNCWTRANGTNDPSAWRCGTPDSLIRDPCWFMPWSAPNSEDAACIDSPWDNSVIVLATPKRANVADLGTPRSRERLDPWALELRHPMKRDQALQCVWQQGNGVQEIHQMRQNWACYRKGHAGKEKSLVGYAWGDVDISHPLNTVAFTEARDSEVRQAEVTDVWP